LFASIGIAVINALTSGSQGWLELVVVNGLVLGFIYLLERFLLIEEAVEPLRHKINVTFPVADLENGLLEEKVAILASKMNIHVEEINISKVDYALGTALIQVYYEK